MAEELEKVLEEKVKPILSSAMHKYLGITIDEIKVDISDKIKNRPLLDFDIDTGIPFKRAKKNFKKHYLTKLLRNHAGNIQEASKAADIDRRSMHRLIAELKINVEHLREESFAPAYVRQEAVKGIIEKSLDSYKTILRPEKIKVLYEHTPEISRDIMRELPERQLTLKSAEQEFESGYISKALAENNQNISKTARAIGLRFETLHRKIKSLGIE